MAQFFTSFRLPILAGFLVGTSYIPLPPWATAFCLVPLWIWWAEQNKISQVFWGGWITQYVFTFIGFNWVAYTVYEFGNLPWPVAILALLLFCGFANLNIPLAGVLWFWLNKRFNPSPFVAAVGLAGITALTELIYPMIFEWHFGYSWYYLGWPAYHLAEWIGFRGLSTITIVINASIFYAYSSPAHRRKVSACLLAALVGLNLLGWWLKARLHQPDKVAKILIAQANIGNSEKQAVEHEATYRDDILDKFFSLTSQAQKSAGPVDLAVWPETAFPHILDEPYRLNTSWGHRLRLYLMENRLPLVTGGYGYRAGTQQIANSLFVFDENGQPTDTSYSKTHLLAFGEYFPGAQWFPFLQKLVPEVGSFARGDGPQVKQLNSFKIGPLICYEGLFAYFSRDLSRQGTQILVNVTNDSWYGWWSEPYQHMYMTLARAVEVRRPLVRATNTGISTIVLGSGQILKRSPLSQPWSGVYDIPYDSNPKPTLFMSWGFYVSWIIAIVLLIMYLGAGIRARTEHS